MSSGKRFAADRRYADATAYGEQLVDAGTATPEDMGVMSQIYFLQRDCKNSAIWSDKAAAAARSAGEAPDERWLQFKLQCASDAGDNAAMTPVLVDLIRLTRKTGYWNTLLRIERQDERDDHNLLMVYRIMYATQSMDKGSDYLEMAALLGDTALPSEAAYLSPTTLDH